MRFFGIGGQSGDGNIVDNTFKKLNRPGAGRPNRHGRDEGNDQRAFDDETYAESTESGFFFAIAHLGSPGGDFLLPIMKDGSAMDKLKIPLIDLENIRCDGVGDIGQIERGDLAVARRAIFSGHARLYG